jgi:hypothetical protein
MPCSIFWTMTSPLSSRIHRRTASNGADDENGYRGQALHEAPFADWALATEREHHTKRLTSDIEAIRAFYDTMFPRMAEMVQYLNAFPRHSTLTASFP